MNFKRLMFVVLISLAVIGSAWAVTFTDDFDVTGGRVNPGWSTDPAIDPTATYDPARAGNLVGNSGATNGVGNLGDIAWDTTAPGPFAGPGNAGKLRVEFDAIPSGGDHVEVMFGSSSPVSMWSSSTLRVMMRRESTSNPAGLTLLSSDPQLIYQEDKPFTGITDDNWHHFKVEFNGIGDDLVSIWVDSVFKGAWDLATLDGNVAGNMPGPGTANNKVGLDYIAITSNGAQSAFIDNVSIFNTVSGASSPDPVNGDTTCYISDIVLSWVPGVDASSHDVYFDTNPNPTTLLQSGVAVVEPRTSVNAPTPLVAGTTYYWRVDTNAPNPNTIGSVWSFTMEDPYCYCGQPGQVYNPMDFDTNCVVDFLDFAAFGAQWLSCTDPTDQVNCDSWNGQ